MTTCVHRVQKSKGAQYGTTVVLHLVVLLMLHGTAADNLPWVANEVCSVHIRKDIHPNIQPPHTFTAAGGV